MAWGAAGQKDNEVTLFAVARLRRSSRISSSLCSSVPGGKAHIKDLSVVASDDIDAPVRDWKIVRSRVKGDAAFGKR